MSNGYSQALSGESDRKGKKKKKKKAKRKGRRRNIEDDSDGSDESDESDASDYSGSDDNSDSDDEDSSSRRHQRRRGRNGGNNSFVKDVSIPSFGIHLPELKIFPEILKEPALLVQLLNMPDIKNIQRTMKTDTVTAARNFRKCVLYLWPQMTVHGTSYSHEHGGVEDVERRRLRPTKTAKNMLGSVQRANLNHPFMSNIENDGGSGWNKPFHIREVTVQAPDTACAFSSLQNMILASVTGKAKNPRKVKRGGNSPSRRKQKRRDSWD